MGAHALPSSRDARNITETYGDLEWLEDPTFIFADCFEPPQPKAQPRAWGRIAVPTAITRRSDRKIYKRISAKPALDRRYFAVVAELEGQSLDPRKRSRIAEYVVPYGGAEFASEIRPDVNGAQDLDEARDQVDSALKNIWKENLRLRNLAACQKTKRRPFDPAQLTWIPRKRHNTRWPVNPPTEHSAFIAKLQPLIKFELYPSQIDEAIAFDCGSSSIGGVTEEHGTQQNGVPKSPRVPEPEEPTQQINRRKSSHRRRTLRPSLSTITEATDEAPASPLLTLTPGPTRPLSSSSARRAQWPEDTIKTPTKVADSSLNEFFISVTPKKNGTQIPDPFEQAAVAPSPAGHEKGSIHWPVMDSADQVGVPSPSKLEAITTNTPVFNHARHLHAPSSINIGSTMSQTSGFNKDERFRAPSTIYSDSTPTVAESSTTFFTALPFFDQPIPETQIEPEHESRRRFSLDNARRSDRTSDVRIIKRFRNWMTGSVTIKRRYSDVGEMTGEHQEPKRRHTLDVDAGLNPDIFGQLPTLPDHKRAAPMESVQIFYEAVAKPKNHTQISAAARVEQSILPPKTTLVQDEETAIPESEETEEHTESEDIEENLDSEKDHENVEGDSDMIYLQSFIQRSKSSKGDKREEIFSAPILSKRNPKKRRSGSMGSATSDAGSPKGRMSTTPVTTTSSPRVPLGERDANQSPSPSKKRKLKGLEQESVPLKKKTGRLVAPDLDDNEPSFSRKKRRKRTESDTDDIFNPNMDMNQVLTQRAGAVGAGSRRSTRIATICPKPATPAIPVRLPGSAAHMLADNDDMPAVSTAGVTNAAFQRKFDKDLTTETRTNTRRNRGGAVSVQVALASMAERSRDGNETTMNMFVEPKVGRPCGGKAVRWDETIARVQGQEAVVLTSIEKENEIESGLALELAEKEEEEEDEEDMQLPSPPRLRVVEPSPNRPRYPAGKQLGENDDDNEPFAKKVAPALSPGPVRRSSRASGASRLPKRGNGGAAAATGATAVTATTAAVALPPLLPIPTPKRRASLLPAPSSRVSKADGRGGKAAAAATEAARARLGMAGPGTPAPRRGGRRGVRR